VIKSVEQLAVEGKRVFVRVDFNVPQDKATRKVTDDARIRAALPTIQHLIERGARIVLGSHLGRPDGVAKPETSLEPVASRLAELLAMEIALADEPAGDGARKVVSDLRDGQIAMLENLRFNPGEEANDETFARTLASYCDVYVNDAFGTAHRAEASTHGIDRFAPVACAGPLLAGELDALGRALAHPKRPLVAIVAGSKVSTKLTILKSLSQRVDQLIVGGGIANTFMLAAGLPIVKSLCEADLAPEAKEIMVMMQARGAAVPVPTDAVVGKSFAADAQATVKPAKEVDDDDMILDIGPKTSAAYAKVLQEAGTIVWNGPVGVFEFDAFGNGTKAVAEAIAASKAFSIAGGGDTLAAIAKYKVTDKIGYISTGGGAFLEFLEGRKLPAVEVLEQRAAGAKKA